MENNTGYALVFFGKHIEPTEEQREAIEHRKYTAKVIEESICTIAEEVLVRLKTEIDEMDIETLLKVGMEMGSLGTTISLMRTKDPD